MSNENHKEVLKIQGALQSLDGEYTSMDETIEELVKCYNKHCKGKKR